MKITFRLVTLLAFASCGPDIGSSSKEIASASVTTAENEKPVLKSGDIVFQNAQSRQCKAIELATHSQYTHCGIIFWKDKQCYVLEAVQPVTYTLFDDWVERGLNKH